MQTVVSMRTVGVMVGISLALVSLYMFLYIPEALRLSRLKAEHNALSGDLAAARQKISLRPSVDQDIARVKKLISKLEATTVQEDEISLAIEAFEAEAYRLGMAKGVLIKVIDTKDKDTGETKEGEEPSNKVRSLRFSIVLRCAYKEFLGYVSSLGKLPIRVTVDSVAVQKVEGTGLRAELEVCTYSLQ
jgi:Tfp pilus assembly protein PilO